ncbi:translation initiation factor [Synechocystis salina LEGE 06099]|uniref:translation initiation factor n=1 Tax=Synechocystis salina TaxID=945780 RepID=UPI00187EC0A2|nr:translation initiation factor [Synechocystis salina]MBE9202412.1 translation initiation factor [Synechocystis salina LEGE 06099]
MASSKPPARIVYQEFGPVADPTSEEEIDLPPQQQNVRIQATRSGRKGKTVTVVHGLQLSTPGRQALLKALKNFCGSGGTLKEDCLEIQGDQREKILAYLLKQGYKAKISGG